MNKKLLILLVLFFNFHLSQAQCAYTGTPLTSVGTFTFCIDNGNTITTPSVASGQFAIVNVVQGFRYSFTVGNVFSGQENLTIFNAANNLSLGPGSFDSGGSGASIINWISTISGQIKVLLSSGSCSNDNTSGGPLTLTLSAIGNTFDSQTTSGTNQWIGHVYNHTDANPPPGGENSPTSPATTTPFTATNYVGYYNIASETINENFGGDGACFPVLSNNGVRTNIFTELFSVRYRMRSTRAAGCYILNVNGDDGVRVYVNGVLVFSRWLQQGNTSYCNNLINLTGNSEIILDYYEHQGQNVVGFSLTPFDGSGNAITSSTNVAVCSNIASTITASNLISCNNNTNTVYQWQSSPDNTTFTNIAGANGRDYTVPAVTVTAGAANNLRYFRRVFKPSTLAAGTCEFFSNVVTVTTSGVVPSAPSAVSGNQNQCRGSSGTFSVTPVTNAVSYNWTTTATGWIITPATNGLSATVAFSATAASGDLQVAATNGCGTSSNILYAIQVRDIPTSSTISGTTTVCAGAPAPAITVTNPQAYNVNVTYNINGGSNQNINVGPNATATVAAPTATTGIFVYNLVSVTNGVGFPSCSTNITGSATVTVGAAIGDQVSYGNNSWIGYVYAGPNPQNSNFSTNFVGSITRPETFDLDLNNGSITGTGLCGSYADDYAVRFKMNRNLPAGCYSFIVGADDGYRLSLDGGATFVVNNWIVSGYREETYNVYLSGNTNFVVEYFEAAGQARFRFNSSFIPLERPTVASTVQPNCITPTGSVRLTGLPSSGSWTLARGGTSIATFTNTGSETTINGLAPGTYTFTITSGSCTSAATGNVVIDPVITTTFTLGTWSTPPTLDKIGIISSNTTITADVVLCNCTVNTGVSATVASGVTLKLKDRLTISGTGAVTFENNASLVQINDVTNSGNIIYKRVTGTGVLVTDYTYWSSPVSPLNLAGAGGIAYNPSTHRGSRFFSYLNNVSTGAWQPELASRQMEVGKGYIIRGPNAIPTTPLTLLEATFVGVPNNGNIALAGGIIANRSYLLGNPYPSAIDADKFLNANSAVLGGTLYFWTHNTPITSGLYTSDDYATYTLTGGVGTAVANSDLNKLVTNLARPTGKIGAGQGFFAGTKPTAPAGSNIVFNNEMRTGSLGVPLINSQFFRTSKTNSKTTNEVEKNRIWLNLTNSGGAFKQLLVGYITGATNDYDSSYDGNSFSANKYINFYSVLNSNLLTIQGRALPFDPSDLVPLGYASTIPGEFSISIDEVDGALKSQDVFVEDKMLDIVHDLKAAPYKFVTAIGTFNDRFVLRYSNRTLANENFDVVGNSIIVSKDKNELKVKSQSETIQRITVFNLLGKKVLDQDDINSNEFRSSNNNVINQTVIVKITLTTGIVISKKVAF